MGPTWPYGFWPWVLSHALARALQVSLLVHSEWGEPNAGRACHTSASRLPGWNKPRVGRTQHVSASGHSVKMVVGGARCWACLPRVGFWVLRGRPWALPPWLLGYPGIKGRLVVGLSNTSGHSGKYRGTPYP
ncbi:hypothetical protein E2562_015004 [Oryza meyeriana var. granulata]|uniref:Secreted protein n=1 Tax=Oryza meyeriana var. granulata TaxID=110450 RepID=A0A6G1ELQ0_9ORYZ|nr:hypothetical protein E2562_015004 [Oryza meyeriana var. granulata]